MAKSASERITDEVTSWPGVTAGTGRRGEWSFKFGRKEVGHLHGDRAAHFVFPKSVWAELVRAGPHRRSPGVPGQGRTGRAPDRRRG